MIPLDITITQSRLEDQIGWYDAKSTTNKLWFIGLKVISLVAGAFIPLLAGYETPRYILGGLGVVIVILEGLQQLLQYHANWLNYRSTSESLKHEKYLFFAGAGPYESEATRDRLLAERIESLVSHEHFKWVKTQEETVKKSSHEQSTEDPPPD
jgi:hypothetical protein